MGVRQCAHRFLERSGRVDPVRIENVDIIEPHARETLVETGEEILARAAVTIGSWPHVVARLGRDDQFVAVRPEICGHPTAEIFLR